MAVHSSPQIGPHPRPIPALVAQPVVRVHLHTVERKDFIPWIPLECELEVVLPDGITNEIPDPLGTVVFLQARCPLLDDEIAIPTNWLQLVGDRCTRRFGAMDEDEFMLMRYNHRNGRVPAYRLPHGLCHRQFHRQSQPSLVGLHSRWPRRNGTNSSPDGSSRAKVPSTYVTFSSPTASARSMTASACRPVWRKTLRRSSKPVA